MVESQGQGNRSPLEGSTVPAGVGKSGSTAPQGADFRSGSASRETAPFDLEPPASVEGDSRSANPNSRSDAAQPSLEARRILAGRYQILRFIGRGAMGEVYEANDIALHEHIALKIIAPEIASDQRALARFKREIQLARKVTHPNVCRIFDMGPQQDQVYQQGGSSTPELTFLTMEFLAGETLADRLCREGPMSETEALPILEQVAAGLDAAHRAGVIHRDLKCSNIMLIAAADGVRAVITDFGLARLSEPSLLLQSESISTVDEIVGTPAYMSPEQVRGENASTPSDIYEFGVVIFATVTGRLPFEGNTPRLTALKRLEADAPSPKTYVPGLDVSWERAIGRCLARDPGARFQYAVDVVRAARGELDDEDGETTAAPARQGRFLRSSSLHWAVALFCITALAAVAVVSYLPQVRNRIEAAFGLAPLPADRQLAVLPFTALNGDQATGAFAKGLAETLTARLTKLTDKHSLQVIPTRELTNNRIETVLQARQEFGINLGLEGSVQQSGSMLRVSYQLIDTKTMRQLRGDTITASVSDPFALEDAVADSVARALELELQPNERAALVAGRTTQPSAYDFFLQGRGYLQDYLKPANLESAISEFNHSLELDANYAPAYAGLGEAYWYSYENTHDLSWVKQAMEACSRALQHDERSAETHNCLGTVYQGTGRYELAVLQFERALELEPTNDDSVRGLASAYAHMNKPGEAEETYRRAIALRPQYWRGYNMIGAFYYANARPEEAAKMFRQVIALAPDNYRGYSNLGGVYLYQGRYAEARPLFERAAAIQPTADAYSNLATAYFHLRQFPEAADTFEKAVELNERSHVLWGNLADAEDRTPGRHAAAQEAYRKAIALAEQELQVNPRDTDVLGDLADYYSMLGNQQQALTYLHRALALAPEDASVKFQAAQVYVQLGDSSTAAGWLVEALKAGYSSTIVRDSPVMDNLRSDPRVQALLRPG